MDLQEMLEDARRRELAIAREYEVRTAEYQEKKLKNDELRRNLEKEEKELRDLIPLEHFVDGSEWAQVLEEIRVLERLIGDEQ